MIFGIAIQLLDSFYDLPVNKLCLTQYTVTILWLNGPKKNQLFLTHDNSLLKKIKFLIEKYYRLLKFIWINRFVLKMNSFHKSHAEIQWKTAKNGMQHYLVIQLFRAVEKCSQIQLKKVKSGFVSKQTYRHSLEKSFHLLYIEMKLIFQSYTTLIGSKWCPTLNAKNTENGSVQPCTHWSVWREIFCQQLSKRLCLRLRFLSLECNE